MSQSHIEKNKALVLEAFDTLFNKRDYARAERYWSSDYIQHSAHIAPGRDGLFNLIKSLPSTLRYEPGTIVAEGDFNSSNGALKQSCHYSVGPNLNRILPLLGVRSTDGADSADPGPLYCNHTTASGDT